MNRVQLSPSILTADFGRLSDEVASVDPYVDWFHLDVMDGHYVDNLTFGASTVAAVRRATDRPLHVHLMISEPEKFAPSFAEAGATRISFHPEVTADPGRTIGIIREAGSEAGIAVHPDIPVSVVEPHLDSVRVVLMMTVRPGFGGQSFLNDVVPKISEARDLLHRSSKSAEIDIEVDGGVNLETLERTLEAGADIVVAGSAIFDGVDATAAAKRLSDRLEQYARGVR